MNEKYLTKIEVNLPIKPKAIRKVLPKIIDLFLDTDGIGGCTYSIPSDPPMLKGLWLDPKTKKRVDDSIVWIYGCYDIENASIGIKDLIKLIKELVEKEAGEDLAWITYSNVCILTA